ncbi:hypothetical protein ASC97_30530 [Rhizobium sp. Root1203]|nr:hypothetical protein ASC97_30530 [Rhizobium sp. Root1203]
MPSKVLNELALPMMPDFGIDSLGLWAEEEANKLYQISRHTSLEDVQNNWDRFHADPRWQEGLARIRQDRVARGEGDDGPLRPINGLPPAVFYRAEMKDVL